MTGSIPRFAVVLACGVAVAGAASSAPEYQQRSGPKRPASVSPRFVLNCDPFGTIAQAHPIDGSCNKSGLGRANSRAQNEVKNTLCAGPAATVVDRAVLVALQQSLPPSSHSGSLPWGDPQFVPTRKQRQALKHPSPEFAVGEGSLVQFVGYVLEGRYSNTLDGEDVNCRRLGDANNDIHLYLGEGFTDPLTQSITAEISPHYRPNAWEVLGTFNSPSGAPAVQAMLQQRNLDRPIRFTGQLMFDASHCPATGFCIAQDRGPVRISSWEVHPLYKIDVCTARDLSACRAVDDAVWVPFHQWVVGIRAE